ncbi:hypothetical protein KCU64_g14809, partial [Aureobasidium melanogenum]
MSTAYPSYESLVTTNSTPFPSPTYLRIRWILRSDETSHSIFILDDPTDSTSGEEPYSPTHPICDTALTCPPISSIIIPVENLNRYTREWLYWHDEDHFDKQDGPPRFDAQGRIEHCCGEDRPGPGPQLEIVAEDGKFVTVGQFVNTLHPWLRGLDGQLRAAIGVVDSWPLDLAHDLIVRAWQSPIRVADTKGWTPANWIEEREVQVGIAKKTLENMGKAGL